MNIKEVTQDRDGDLTTIRITIESSVPADRVVAGATDFTTRRSTIFDAVQPKYFVVHELGDGHADVTEGTRSGLLFAWERCRYEWTSRRVTATVIDTNVYGIPGSKWELGAEPSGAGSTVVITWTRRFNRRPTGRLLGFIFPRFGKRLFAKYAGQIVGAIENLEVASYH
jgi:hypothetical protein